MPIDMRKRFTHDNLSDDNNAFYERNHADPETARVWTLHLRVDEPQRFVGSLIDEILRTGADFLTTEYQGGDSWREWCEPDDGGDKALHVYLVAPDADTALHRARMLSDRVRIVAPDAVFLTTAGDHGVHVGPVWEAAPCAAFSVAGQRTA